MSQVARVFKSGKEAPEAAAPAAPEEVVSAAYDLNAWKPLVAVARWLASTGVRADTDLARTLRGLVAKGHTRRRALERASAPWREP